MYECFPFDNEYDFAVLNNNCEYLINAAGYLVSPFVQYSASKTQLYLRPFTIMKDQILKKSISFDLYVVILDCGFG